MPKRFDDNRYDDAATRRWCAALEAKSTSAMQFPTFGGLPYAQGIGFLDGSTWNTFLPDAQRDYDAEAGPLWLNSAVAAGLGWIIDNFDEPRFGIARLNAEGDEEPVPFHRAEQTLAEPNPDYDASALWMATLVDFITSRTGDTFWLKASAPSRQNMWLYWVPSWEMEPRWRADATQFIDHYDHVVDGRRTPIPKSSIVHFRRGLGPTNSRRGLAQLGSVLREICTDNSANTYTAALLRNWGITGIVITPEDPGVEISPDEAQVIKDGWSEKTTGDNAGRPIVNSRRLKLQNISVSPDKMALDKIRQVPTERICSLLRIDPMVLGLSSSSKTYSNYPEARRAAYRDCLIPLQKRFARTITRQLLTELGGQPGEFCRWDNSRVEALAPDMLLTAKRSQILISSDQITVNEGRSMNGLKPRPAPGANKLRSEMAAERGEAPPAIDPAAAADDDEPNAAGNAADDRKTEPRSERDPSAEDPTE